MNKDFISLLETYTKWNRGEIENPDVSELVFSDMKIDDFDFSPYDLSGSIFAGVMFSVCSFQSVYISHTFFGGSCFLNCKFENNAIRKAQWNCVRMEHTSIKAMNVLKSDFMKLELHDCTAEDSSFRRVNFFRSHMKNMVFTRCILQDCSFCEVNLENVQFIDCTFMDTNINFAHPGAVFMNCKN